MKEGFLESTSIRWAWDATCISAFKKCPRYYQLRYVEGWTNDGGIHLRWGNEFHKALEDYDRHKVRGHSHVQATHFTLRSTLVRIADWEPEPETKSEETKSKVNLIRAIEWYLDHYHPDPAETYILQDGQPAVELNFNFEVEFGPKKYKTWHYGGERGERNPEAYYEERYSLCGYLDRIVVFNDDLYVMDRKSTTSTPSSYYFDKFDLDDQMSLYNLAAKVLLKTAIRGVIVDAVQVTDKDIRPVRSFTYRTEEQLEEWLNELQIWLGMAETMATVDYWPMNLNSCDKYGGCEFRKVCSKSPSVREKFLKGDMKRKELWNPLKPR